MLAFIFSLFLTTAAHAAPTCDWSDADLDLCVVAEWGKKPTATKDNELLLSLSHLSTGLPYAPSQLSGVEVVPWMNMGGHGHGTTPLTLTSYDRLALVFARKINFLMPGEWEIRVTFKRITTHGMSFVKTWTFAVQI